MAVHAASLGAMRFCTQFYEQRSALEMTYEYACEFYARASVYFACLCLCASPYQGLLSHFVPVCTHLKKSYADACFHPKACFCVVLVNIRSRKPDVLSAWALAGVCVSMSCMCQCLHMCAGVWHLALSTVDER